MRSVFRSLSSYLASATLLIGSVFVTGCSSHPGADADPTGISEYTGQSTATMLATISVNTDATKLVFAGSVAPPNGGDVTKNLFVLDLKTLHITRLTTTDECQSDPAYSFDGKKIAYVSRAHENEPSHIFICDADGTHARQVTTVPNVEDHHPAFSHDGTRLVFSRSNRFIPDSRGYDTWTDIDVYAIKTDGTDEQRLTTGNYNSVMSPVFYPYSERVLFDQTSGGHGANYITHICELDISSKVPNPSVPIRRVVTSSDNDFCPFFYPDGHHIVFSSSLGSPNDPALRSYDLDTNANVLLQPTTDGEPDNCPVVTQDGKHIYFLRGYGANIWVLDTATNAAHQVADGSIYDNPLGWKPSR